MKENSLTTEQLSRVFGERIGQQVHFENSAFESTFNLYGVRYSHEDVLWLTDSINPEVDVDYCKLLLTPLEKINNEDAEKLLRINQFFSGELRIRRSEIFDSQFKIYYEWGSDDEERIFLRNIKFGLQNREFEFLKQQGYDVPMFFGIDHPDNGKTLISMGVGIDKTTI